jgi:hypothetical protein
MKPGARLRGPGAEPHGPAREQPLITEKPEGWRWAGGVLILAAAAVAVAPQVIRGDSCGHDFDFHLVSWLDALNAWRHGIVYPHWTTSANYGAGEPRFVFYSPLTWMLGAALGAVLPWAEVPVALTFLLLAGTGLATRALARDALDEAGATLAGCIAVFCGYALFTAYERSAFAELAGGIWIPLVLKYALRERGARVAGESHLIADGRTLSGRDWRNALGGSNVPLAIAIAGSWFSNPTVGVMACYTLAAVALVLAWLDRSWRPVVRAALGAVLGLGVAAVYLVPAALEQRWVDIHQVTEDPGQKLENSWLFARHSDPALALHDQVLHTVSMIAVAMLALACTGLLVCWLRRRMPGPRSWWIPLALIPAAVLLLQFPFSLPIWNLLPELRFLQFPWRWLLVLEGPMAVFAAAAIWPRSAAARGRRIAVGIACAAVFVAIAAYETSELFQVCYPEDTVRGMLSVYRAGTGFEGTYEYEPIGADISRIPMNLPEACLVSDAATALGRTNDDGDLVWNNGQGSCEATYGATENGNPEHMRVAAQTNRAGFLILRLLSYPAWRVEVNGQIADSLPRRADGLIAVPVPAGRVQVSVDWTTTRDVWLARWLSLLSVLVLTGACVMARIRTRTRVS